MHRIEKFIRASHDLCRRFCTPWHCNTCHHLQMWNSVIFVELVDCNIQPLLWSVIQVDRMYQTFVLIIQQQVEVEKRQFEDPSKASLTHQFMNIARKSVQELPRCSWSQKCKHSHWLFDEKQHYFDIYKQDFRIMPSDKWCVQGWCNCNIRREKGCIEQIGHRAWIWKRSPLKLWHWAWLYRGYEHFSTHSRIIHLRQTSEKYISSKFYCQHVKISLMNLQASPSNHSELHCIPWNGKSLVERPFQGLRFGDSSTISISNCGWTSQSYFKKYQFRFPRGGHLSDCLVSIIFGPLNFFRHTEVAFL